MTWARALAFLVSVLLLGATARPAAAQDDADAQPGDGEYTIAEYLGLRAEIVRADAALQELTPGTPEHIDATAALTEQVNGAVRYLNGWIASGEMPEDLRAEAAVQRYVFFENLVQLHAALGDCLASRSAVEAMRAVEPRSTGFGYTDLLDSAEDVLAGCEQRAWLPEPAETPTESAGAIPTALWATGSALAVSGIVIAIAYADERRELDDLHSGNTVLPPSQVLRRDDLETRVTRTTRAAAALTSVGSSLVISGVVTQVLERRRRSAVSVAVGPGSMSVAVHATW